MQGNPHVRFDEQGVETDRLISPTGEPHDTAPPPDSTGHRRETMVKPRVTFGPSRSSSCRAAAERRPLQCLAAEHRSNAAEVRSGGPHLGHQPRAPRGYNQGLNLAAGIIRREIVERLSPKILPPRNHADAPAGILI